MPPLIIFPEGSVTNGTALFKFKKGSFVFHTPLKLNAMTFNYNRLNPYFSEVGSILELFLLGMCNWYNTVTFY